MPSDDIIITGLDESIAIFFDGSMRINEDLSTRMAQRNADAINGELKGVSGWSQRNKFGINAGTDYLAASLQGRFTNPEFLLNTLPQLGQNAINGAQRAAAEREQKQQQRALEREQRDLANEEKKVQREQISLQKEIEKRYMAEAISPEFVKFLDKTVGGAYDWGVGTARGGSNILVSPTVTGNNVETFTLKNGKQIGVATDTRGTAQRRVDALTDIGKSYADQYVQRGIDTALNKGSELLGYGAAKAKFAIEDMRARKAQAKAVAKQLNDEKQALNRSR